MTAAPTPALPPSCYANGVPQSYIPDTMNNYELGWKTTSLDGRLIWNGATYLMDWKQFQTHYLRPERLLLEQLLRQRRGRAHLRRRIEHRLQLSTITGRCRPSGSYTDSHIISSAYPAFQPNVGERLPFVPYFSWSWNARYEAPLNAQLKGYAQFDMADKGDMWDDLHVQGSNGFPRILQPSYTIMNLRFGLNPAGGHWLAELYVTNLANKNAIVYTNTGNFDLRLTTNEPRVYGLRVNYRFGKETNAD